MTVRRTVLGVVVVAGAVFAAVAVVVFGVRALEAVVPVHPAVASALRRTGIFLAALGAYRATSRWWEQRPTPELAVRPAAIVAGAAAGAGWIAVPLAVGYAAGGYEVTGVRGVAPGLAGLFVLIVVAAFLEELVYRAVLFRILEQGLGTPVAVAVTSVVFSVAHIGNGEGTLLDEVVFLVTGVAIGAMWTLLFAWTRDLWVVTANHALWNFTILLTGLTLSGIEDWHELAPISSRDAGPMWLTGGTYGPESSAVTLVWVVGWVVALWRWTRADPLTVSTT